MSVAPVAIQTIVFHKHAERHIDDAACLWIARTRPEAEARFPGISTAEIIFDGTGGETYEGKSGDQLEQEGILMFGVGGGRFDAHPGPNNPGKAGCEFSLFCKEIGIHDDPALSRIISYVAESDRGNSGHSMSVGALAKIMHRRWPDEPMKVFEWQIDALSAVYAQQMEFCQAQFEYDEKAKKQWIKSPLGRDILVVTVVSANEQMNNCARSLGASIVIQQRPRDCEILPGNIAVYTDNKARISLKDVAANIRQEEQRVRGRPVTTDSQKLRAPAKMEGVLEWFYLTGGNGEMLLNGSSSAPHTPATKIPLKTIEDIVVANLCQR